MCTGHNEVGCARLCLYTHPSCTLWSCRVHAVLIAAHVVRFPPNHTAALSRATPTHTLNQLNKQVLSLKMNCTDVVLSPQGDVESLQRTLYCGYYQARCNGSTTTAQ